LKIKKSIFIGALLATIVIVLLNGLIHSSILLLIGANILNYDFTIWGITPTVELNNEIGVFLKTILILLPLILNFVFVESSFLLLKKTSQGFARNTIIIFLLLIAGYLLIVVFYGMIELIINPSAQSSWKNILELWNFVGNQLYVFVALVILALFSYLQIMQKRIMRFITINKME
jgi:hypothetical protein